MLEQQIERLNTNIETLICVMSGQAANETAALMANETRTSQSKDTPVTREIVRTALIELSKNKGRAPAEKILSDFDARKVGDIKDEDLAAILEQIQQSSQVA